MRDISPLILASIVSVMLIAGCIGQTATPGAGTPVTPGVGTQGGTGTPESPAAGAVAVQIMNYAFHPANLTVSLGTTITWTNYDNVPHLVYYKSGGPTLYGGFGSPTLSRGMNWSWTPNVAGTFVYMCSIHPQMEGVITVVP